MLYCPASRTLVHLKKNTYCWSQSWLHICPSIASSCFETTKWYIPSSNTPNSLWRQNGRQSFDFTPLPTSGAKKGKKIYRCFLQRVLVLVLMLYVVIKWKQVQVLSKKIPWIPTKGVGYYDFKQFEASPFGKNSWYLVARDLNNKMQSTDVGWTNKLAL